MPTVDYGTARPGSVSTLAPKESYIQQSLRELTDANNSLMAAVTELSKRLDSVLTPDSPHPVKDNAGNIKVVDEYRLSQRISSECEKVRISQLIVSDILTRLEV